MKPVLLGAFLLSLSTAAASAQNLANASFQLQYDDSGISSLRRTNDVHDTEYIAQNGRLGRLLVRYRTAVNGDWRELREMRLSGQEPGRSVSYTLGERLPTLASRASAVAQTGAGGLRGLNDGLVPSPPRPGGGRGGGPGAPVAAAPFAGPLFTWSGARGATQWVQYTFPDDQEISKVEVFWVQPPDSWRLLYQDGGEWKEVAARGAYGVAPNAFAPVEFAPVKTMALRIEGRIAPEDTVSIAEWRVGGDPGIAVPRDLAVSEAFALDDDRLDWTITLRNRGTRPVEIGDLAVPFNFAERTGARGDIYTKKLIRHAYVGGHASFVAWQRSNGVGPFLVVTPQGSTKFEYYDSSGGAFTPYVHAKVARAAAEAEGGHWRLPVSGATIAPGATMTCAFRFGWAKDSAAVRDELFQQGKIDISIVPGMVVPSDLTALFALRTNQKITSVVAEHPSATRVERLAGAGGPGTVVYRASFSRLGENMLRVEYGDRQWASLEFFVTEPLETVIKKRASFLVTHHQHTDPSKWYVGMYSDWDQKNEIRRSPEDRDGLSTWLTDANDDAGNARPAYIASKNVFFPDQKEIESLELYIDKYLWGGMQMTDKEKYPYAIYGIPNFKANRASADPGRNGQAHVWRIYDYPHIVMLYYRMFHIAKFYPQMVKHLDAATYLERAYRTAVAYWTVPMAVEKWSADAVGTMNEAFIPELIDTLEREGKKEWADTLRGYWEGKVERFVMKTPNLYGSEFAFDSTGFESTGSFAKYATTRNTPSFRTRVPEEAAKTFMNFQLRLNMTDRGWLEPTYYQLGTDYRGNASYLLSYMSQMGGWSILDYALHFATDPTDYLRLGYASSLSSWALVNSGTKESGYGYWFPSPNNDGAAGGGFMPEASGRAWIGKTMTRGAWHYSAEEDVGYCGALRTHATIVARDPVFGELAYGGTLTRSGTAVSVVPRDGLRVRFHVVRGDQRLHLELEHDGFAKEQPVVVSDALDRVEFALENRGGGAHETVLRVAGLPEGRYEVTANGRRVLEMQGGAASASVGLPVGATGTTRVEVKRVR